MSTTLFDQTDTRTSTTPAERLRTTTAAVRLSIRWFGVRKTLTPQQIDRAAEPFGAEGQFLSARKKLLDTRHPAYKEVTAVRGRAAAYWRGTTLPYTESGVRLLPQDRVEAFNQRMVELRGEPTGQGVGRFGADRAPLGLGGEADAGAPLPPASRWSV